MSKQKMLRLAWTASQNGLRLCVHSVGLCASPHGLAQNMWGSVKTSTFFVISSSIHYAEKESSII
jgi:hypothetical protein